VDLLADENAGTEWVQALRGDGHDVARVVDRPDLGVGAPDPEVVAVATREDRVLLTSDRSDFADHAGVIVVGSARSGGEVRRAVRRIEDVVPDLTSHVLFVSDWL
jgi:predicted nuclease of predicted toxin-antitoxin system